MFLKIISSIILLFILHYNSYSQSISISELYKYVNSQKKDLIISAIKQKGFVFQTTEESGGLSLSFYIKKGNYGTEVCSFGSNSELFMVLYRPIPSFVQGYSEKIIKCRDYSYAYSAENNTFYESEIDRVGISPTTISLFVKLH